MEGSCPSIPSAPSEADSLLDHRYPITDIKLCTWNMATLFGGGQSRGMRLRPRWGALNKIFSRHQFIFLQETHGHEGDLTTLDDRYPDFIHFGTFCENSAAGGATVSVKRSFLEGCDISSEVLHRGRCLLVRVSCREFVINAVNIHLEPSLSYADKATLLRDIIGRSRGLQETWIYGGDWNFTELGDDRLELGSLRFGSRDERLAELLDGISGHLTETFQPDYTRRALERGEYKGVSRLDRFYVAMPPAELRDRRPFCYTIGTVTSPNNMSDHIPVGLHLSAPNASFSIGERMARWIPSHPIYIEEVLKVINDIQLPTDPFSRISVISSALHDAGRAVRSRASGIGANHTHEKVYWLLRAMSCARVMDRKGLRQAATAYNIIFTWVDLEAGIITDRPSFHSHLNELNLKHIDELLAELDTDQQLQEWKKRDRRETLARRATLWGDRGRKAVNLSVTDADGDPALDNDSAASLLCEHWSQVFSAKRVYDDHMEKLSPFVQRAPDNMEWVLGREEFFLMVSKMRDTSPGPDGLPYTAWGKAGDTVLELVYDAYIALLGGTQLPKGFNHSDMVFIPKGDQAEEDGTFIRKPSETRPLNLSNSVAKIIAAAINNTLSLLCAATVGPCQQGFIRGRSLIDNVVDVEATAVGFDRYYTGKSGIMLVDLAAAFPSLSHLFLFWVLDRMGIPDYFREAIRQLYDNNTCDLLLNGARYPGFDIDGGIRQGCPASGSLYALSFDPFLRFLESLFTVGPGVDIVIRALIRAFADDVAIVLRDILRSLRTIFSAFQTLAKATGMHLNIRKCVIIPLWDRGVFDTRRFVIDEVPELREISVRLAAKYLGNFIGPEADILRWISQLEKYRARVFQVRSGHGGFFGLLRRYKGLCLSLFSFLCQFCPPPGDVLRTEKWAGQVLTRGPWNAIPTDALMEICDLGFSKEFPSLERLGRASALRVVLTSRGFRASLRFATSEPLDDLSVRLLPKERDWHGRTSVLFLRDVEDTLVHIPPLLGDVGRRQLQSKITSLLREGLGVRCTDLIRKRSRRWLEGGYIFGGFGNVVQMFTDNIHRTCKLVPDNLAFSVLRYFCNGLPTSRRFQSDTRDCDFCGLERADGIEHFLVCESIALFRARTFQYGCVPWDLLFVLPSTDKELIGGAVLIDCILYALRAKRIDAHGAHAVQILNARYKHLRVRHRSLEEGLKAAMTV